MTHIHENFHSFIARPSSSPAPAVLVFPTWLGLNDFVKSKAQSLASLGYVAFAVDLYGEGKIAASVEEAKSLVAALMEDRTVLRKRCAGAVAEIKKLPYVDPKKVAAIGFCFGGTCVIELAKSGIELSGVVSFHGVLGNPNHLPMKPVATAPKIKTPLLILNGYLDPLVSEEDLRNFQKEMQDHQADWQLIQYGSAKHSFTNPLMHDEKGGLSYNACADRRSWNAMQAFFNEIF